MKMRVCEYDEKVIGMRLANINFYLDSATGELVACPLIKGDVGFVKDIVEKINKVDDLEKELASSNANPRAVKLMKKRQAIRRCG